MIGGMLKSRHRMAAHCRIVLALTLLGLPQFAWAQTETPPAATAKPLEMPLEIQPPLPAPPMYPQAAQPMYPQVAQPQDAPAPPSTLDSAAQPPPPSKPISGFDFIVPRAFGLTAGWSYTPTNHLPLSADPHALTPQGVNVDAALMWKVRGLDGIRWPAWVGFMLGFFYYFGSSDIKDSVGFDYGIYVKHSVFPGHRLRLFVGYGLGAAQVWIRGIDGRGIGAFTRLSAGTDIHLTRWLQMTVEFSYRFFDLPSFKLQNTDSGGYDFQTLSLLAGFFFGR